MLITLLMQITLAVISADQFGGEPGEGSMSNKRPNKRSRVWEHFEETPDRERAICKHCGSSLSGKSTGGTTHLLRHIEICCKKRDPGDKVRNFGFIQDECWEVEVKKAVLAEIPFSDCKKVLYSLIWPKMDIEKLICNYYEREKERFVTELENLTSQVSFTFDIMEEAGYISLTAHFITNDFNLVKKLIGFKKITDVSSSTCIESTIWSCISDWRLGDKIFMFTHGNDDFAQRVILDLFLNGDFRFSVKCCKQYFTSTLTNILLNIFHWETVKIVKFINSVRTNKSKMDELTQIAKEQGLPAINVGLFMDLNEWKPGYNSIVRIIEYAFRYKEVFCQYAPREAGLMILSQINWERAELILNCSQLLNDMINGLSSFKNPTLNLYIQKKRGNYF